MPRSDLTSVIAAHLPAPKIQAREEDITGGEAELVRGLAPTLFPYIFDVSTPEFQRYYRSTGLICKPISLSGFSRQTMCLTHVFDIRGFTGPAPDDIVRHLKDLDGDAPI